MFERYTEKARRVIFFARFEASVLGSATIEPEHLLLGLLREDKALLNRIVCPHSSIESMRERIEGRIPEGERTSTSTELPLSEASTRVLRYADEEAKGLSHTHIGCGHLVLGLLRDENCIAAEVLHEWGVYLGTARELVLAEREKPEKPGGGVPAKDSLLSEFSRDLTEAARRGELDPLVGREEELDRVVQVLCRRSRNNPVLVGDSGVGKASLVKGLAKRIADKDVPWRLADKRILNLYLSSLAAGSRRTGQFESRLKTIVSELVEERNAIIFVEELFASTGAAASLDAANILQPALHQGDIQCIAAATPEDYQLSIERESWPDRYFVAVRVNPPGLADAVKILFGIKERYEQFHGVTYTDEALEHAVHYSERFIPGRCLPDKAIDLIDEAGACVKLRRHSQPEELIETRKRLALSVQRMEAAIASHEFEKARIYSEEERKQREGLRQLEAKFHLNDACKVTREDIEDAVARWTGLPLDSVRQKGAADQENE